MSTYRPEGLQNLPIPTPEAPAPGRGEPGNFSGHVYQMR